VGAFGMWRWLRRRQAHAPSTAEDPADALRAKLDESRALVDEREAFEEGETPIDEADLDARRRSVHDQARARMDELRGE
jgi:hypothetical protein